MIHGFGGMTAGLVAGALFGWVGSRVDDDLRFIVVAVGLLPVAVLSVIALLRGTRPPMLERNRETSRAWVDRNPYWWAAANGFVLGLGGTTRIAYPVWYLVPLFAFGTGTVWAGMVLFGAYGIFRTGIGPLPLVPLINRHGTDSAVAFIGKTQATLHRVGGGLALLLGTVFLFAGSNSTAADASAQVRACGSDIRMTVPQGPDTAASGPVALGGLDTTNVDLAHYTTANTAGEYAIFKIPTVLLPGDERFVWIEVTDTQSDSVALAFEILPGRSAIRFAEATNLVRFERCQDDGPTGYNGGILVKQPLCVRLNAWTDPGDKYALEFPFGAPCD